MKPKSAKDKGRRLQKYVRDRIVETFRDRLQPDDVQSRSSGAAGEDVMMSPVARECVPFAIECKNTERFSVRSAWAQACEHARGGQHAPMIVTTWNRGPVLAVVELDTLLTLLLYRRKYLDSQR